MRKFLAFLPSTASRKLFGIWLIGIALTDPRAPVHITFSAYAQILAIILIAAGVLTLFGK